jgi:hypothetical protein
MADAVDQEIEAIRVVLGALTPLSEKARASVLDYVTHRLDLVPSPASSAKGLPTIAATQQAPVTPPVPGGTAQHIKQFKEEKRPRSANEMAALVAYYLGNVVPSEQRKATVNIKDIETHFKIAGFPLPRQLRVMLPNAKNAGYFDLVGDGEYKLNAVGHNLVAHSMPRGGGTRSAKPSRRTKKSAAKGTRARNAKTGR